MTRSRKHGTVAWLLVKCAAAAVCYTAAGLGTARRMTAIVYQMHIDTPILLFKFRPVYYRLFYRPVLYAQTICLHIFVPLWCVQCFFNLGDCRKVWGTVTKKVSRRFSPEFVPSFQYASGNPESGEGAVPLPRIFLTSEWKRAHGAFWVLFLCKLVFDD